MPNSVSAKKRLRQSIDRRDRNRAVKSAVRTLIKKVRKAVADGKVAESEEGYKLAAKKLDQAAAKNVVHDNFSARIKSRLMHAIKGIKKAK